MAHISTKNWSLDNWMAGWGTEKDGDEGAIYNIVGYCKVAGNKWEGKPNE